MASSCRVTLSADQTFPLYAILGGVALAAWHVSVSSLSREGRVSLSTHPLFHTSPPFSSEQPSLHASGWLRPALFWRLWWTRVQSSGQRFEPELVTWHAGIELSLCFFKWNQNVKLYFARTAGWRLRLLPRLFFFQRVAEVNAPHL